MLDRKIMTLGSALVLAVVLFLSGCIGGQAPEKQEEGQAQAAAATVMSPFGILSASDAAGEDIPCIGRPAGMVRGLYSRTEEGQEYTVDVVYFKKGLDFQTVKEYFTGKAGACGWQKESEASASISTPQFTLHQGTSVDYSKGPDSLSLSVLTVTGPDGTDYTMAQLTLEHRVEQAQEEQQPAQEQEEEQQVQEQQAPAEAQPYDQLVKPVLSDVFGSASLSSYLVSTSSEGNPMIFLTYQLGTRIDSKNAGDLKQELSAVLTPEGYSNTITTVTSEGFTYSYQAVGGVTITVSGSMGEQEVNVVVVEKQA